MSKVLFIVHDVYQDDNEFPVGVGYLSSILRNKGVEVTVCNQDVYHYTNEEVVEKFIKDKKYDFIGIGFLSARFKETIIPLCNAINKHKGKALLVLGGHGATAIPEYTLLKTGADVVAMGEAEGTVYELITKELSDIKGIAYRDGNKVIVNERREVVKDLDTLPFPAWDLFPIDIYSTCMAFPNADKDDKAMQIVTSRGCVGHCRFCFRMEKGIRFREIKSVIEEMLQLKELYGITYFSVQDELFVVNEKRLEKFVDALNDNNLKIKYDCNLRANTVTESMVKTLKDSGCCYINIGFESVSQKCLDEHNKNVKVADNYRAAKLVKESGMPVGLNLIWGTPSDNEKTLRDSVAFLKRFNTYYVLRTIRPITPYPGSPIYYDAIEKGLLKGPEDFFDRFKNSDLVTVNFTKLDLEKIYEILFDANKELVLDHYQHTNGNMEEANNMIDNFHNLYFKGFTKFRGARTYDKKVLEC